jgi:hypothetical protein
MEDRPDSLGHQEPVWLTYRSINLHIERSLLWQLPALTPLL